MEVERLSAQGAHAGASPETLLDTFCRGMAISYHLLKFGKMQSRLFHHRCIADCPLIEVMRLGVPLT